MAGEQQNGSGERSSAVGTSATCSTIDKCQCRSRKCCIGQPRHDEKGADRSPRERSEDERLKRRLQVGEVPVGQQAARYESRCSDILALVMRDRVGERHQQQPQQDGPGDRCRVS